MVVIRLHTLRDNTFADRKEATPLHQGGAEGSTTQGEQLLDKDRGKAAPAERTEEISRAVHKCEGETSRTCVQQRPCNCRVEWVGRTVNTQET